MHLWADDPPEGRHPAPAVGSRLNNLERKLLGIRADWLLRRKKSVFCPKADIPWEKMTARFPTREPPKRP